MKIQPIEELLPQAGRSVYRLVRMASLRALELADGRPPLISKTYSDRSTTMALEEIRQKKVMCKDTADKSVLSKSEKVEKKTKNSDQNKHGD